MYCGPTAVAHILPRVTWREVTHHILGQRERLGHRASFKRFGGCSLHEVKTYLRQKHSLALVPVWEEKRRSLQARDLPKLFSTGRCRFIVHQPNHFYGVRSRADLKRGARLWGSGHILQVYRVVPV